jgi:hypothetical protein
MILLLIVYRSFLHESDAVKRRKNTDLPVIATNLAELFLRSQAKRPGWERFGRWYMQFSREEQNFADRSYLK